MFVPVRTSAPVPATVAVVESLGYERNVGCRLADGTLVIARQEIEAPVPHVDTSVRLAAEPGLERGDVIDGDDPAHPAAALVGALLNRATEGCLVGRGMVEGGHDLDVAPSGEGQNEIARAERGMTTTIDEGRSEIRADALNSVSELCRGARVRDVIKPHRGILPRPNFGPAGAPRFRDSVAGSAHERRVHGQRSQC